MNAHLTDTDLYWLPRSEDYLARLEALRCTPQDSNCWRAELLSLAAEQSNFLEVRKLDSIVQSSKSDLNAGQMELRTVKLAILSTSTVDHLVPGIRVAGLRRGLDIEVYVGAFGQLTQEILAADSGLARFSPNILLIQVHGEFVESIRGKSGHAEESAEVAVSETANLRELWESPTRQQRRVLRGRTLMSSA